MTGKWGILVVVLYHFVQFGSHASRTPPERRIVTLVTLILARCGKLLAKSKSQKKKLYIILCCEPKISCMIAEKIKLSHQFWQHAETKISADASRITPPAELNEMVE